MFKNPFKKNKDSDKKESSENLAAKMADMPGAPDMSKMNAVQRMAYKQFLKMSPEKQRDVMKKAMTPKNIQKNKGEIIKQLDEMKAAGMMSDDQYRLAKKKFGL
jgi:hypothetical protein